MKKPVFVITEIFLSLVLTASLAAVAALALDLHTGGAIIPPEIYGGKSESKEESSVPEKKENSALQTSSVPEKTETSEASDVSSAEESSEQSGQESSQPAKAQTDTKSFKDQLILSLPESQTEQPSELKEFISDYGLSFDNIFCDHIIVVDGKDGGNADVYCYQKSDNGIWWNINGDGKKFSENAFIGENGPDYEIKPDSKRSPLGFYTLGQGFYIGAQPDSTYPMFEITENTYWVNDSSSPSYNTKVEGTDKKDWSSAIHMITEKEAYKYGLVVNYNTSPIKSELSSSIFIYCGNSPTDGGIAMSDAEVLTLLEWLDKDSIAMICIMA